MLLIDLACHTLPQTKPEGIPFIHLTVFKGKRILFRDKREQNIPVFRTIGNLLTQT